VFQKNNHDETTKSILGRSGNFDGDEFVKIILEQPACSKYITRKLYHYFVKELPPLERAEDHTLDSGIRGALADLSSATVICLDLGLGDMFGLDVLRHVQAREPSLPVVVVTAQDDVETAVAAMRGGAYDYLVKPIDRIKLQHAVRRAFG
jgi:DNA-binding NarL/FixJ family response regulator